MLNGGSVARQPRSEMAVSWIAIAALAATVLGASVTPQNQSLEKSSCGRVWVTVHSPEINLGGASRMLDAVELNWDFSECSVLPRQSHEGSHIVVIHRLRKKEIPLEDGVQHLSVYVDTQKDAAPHLLEVGLFTVAQPRSWNNALSLHSITSAQGHVVTNISLGESPLPAGWEHGAGYKGPHCLWPWVAAGSDHIQAYNCLKIQPTWMEDNVAKINHLRIGDLVIAGTHNAGAWSFNTEVSTVARDSFVLCQDRPIWAQLAHGIRYFDLRVAYYNFYDQEEERYWLNHNLIRVRPLVPILRKVRQYLDNTKEVIFLDAHHFPVGFYNTDGSPIRSVHAGLLELVQRELGPHLALANEFGTGAGTRGPTLKTLLDADKRLLFSYVDNSIVGENNWLWPILPHLWANTNDPNQLFQYLDQAIAISPQPNARSSMHSAMAQTTPTVLDILFLRGSLRESADAVNRNVTARLATRWRTQANIVSTDFFLGNDVIDQSIMLSVERGSRL